MDRIRTCIGCSKKGDKFSMFRIMKTKDDCAKFDKSGKMQGRGAYICSLDCLDKVKRSSRLQSALRCRIDEDTYSMISESLSACLGQTMIAGEE